MGDLEVLQAAASGGSTGCTCIVLHFCRSAVSQTQLFMSETAASWCHSAVKSAQIHEEAFFVRCCALLKATPGAFGEAFWKPNGPGMSWSR